MQTNPLQITILVAVVINLALTGSLFLETRSGSQLAGATQAIDALPSYLTDAELADLATRMSDSYNRDDFNAIYEEFDDIAKVQLSLEQLQDQVQKLRPVVGNIKSAAYTRFDKLEYAGRPVYQLHYVASLSDGPFEKGSLRISILDRGDSYGLIGFFVQGGTE